MSDRPRRIEVTIDELVLHGFEPRHRERIAEAVRSELAEALAGWNPTTGADDAHLDGGSFSVPADASPAAVGRGVARQVAQRLPGGGRSASSQSVGSQSGGSQSGGSQSAGSQSIGSQNQPTGTAGGRT
jgi:hypothetical protein